MRGLRSRALFVEWLNAVIYEMAVRSMLFGRFEVKIAGTRLRRRCGASRSTRAACACLRAERRDLYGARVAQEATASGRPAASSTSEGRPMDPADSPYRRDDMADRAARRDARAGGHLRRRRPDPRHGRQGLRAGRQCRHAARHREGVLCHARRALGLWLPDRRRGGVRSRTRAAWSPLAASASTFPAACAPC